MCYDAIVIIHCAFRKEVSGVVMLYINFSIAPIIGRLFLGKKNGVVDMEKVEKFFPAETAAEIAAFPGLKWKVWAISPNGRHGTGFYLFQTRADAEKRAEYAKKFYPKTPGLYNVKCDIFEVMEESSRVTRADLDCPANPSFTPADYEKWFHPERESMLKKAKRLLAK